MQLFTLERSVPITIRVVDQDQKPIRNAMVVGVHDEQFTSGLTDADGRFITERFRGGPLNFSASHPKYGPASGAVEAGRNEVLIQLQTPGAIDGLLTEAGAPPTPGKWIVTVRSASGMAPQILSRPVTPDIDGRFKVEGLVPGTYSVLATEPLRTLRSPGEIYTSMSEGRMEASRPPVSVLVSSGQRASVHLTTEPEVQNDQGPSARVTGVVTVNGQPVSGLVVSANTVTGHQAYTTERGHFDLGRITEGDHTLKVHTRKAGDSKEHLLWIGKVTVIADEDKDLQILVRTGRLTGTVQSAGGTALEDCTIWVFGYLKGTGDTYTADRVHFETATDRAGSFELSSVPEGTYAVIATKEGIGWQAQEDVHVQQGSATNLELRVEQAYRLTGRLDVALFGNHARAYRMSLAGVHGQGRKAFESFADLGVDGSFEVKDLLPGEYEVSIWVESLEAGAYLPSPVEWTVIGSPLRIGSADSLDVVLRPVRRLQPVEQLPLVEER